MPLTTYAELGPDVQRAAGSIREDLLDFIENVSPADTPLYNNLGQVKVNAGFVEYLEDTLRAAATNAFVEGVAATDKTLTTPSRNYSIVQNFQEHYHVSGRQQAVTHAGISSMLAYQGMKALKALKTDIELALVAGSAVSGTAAVAPQLAGVLNKLSTNFTNASGTTLTETVLGDALSLGYNYSVNLRELYANMPIKRVINSFSTKINKQQDVAARRAGALVDVYDSEVGPIAIFKERNVPKGATMATSGHAWFAIDPDFFKVAWLRPLVESALGKDGDRERRMIVGELTLIVKSEKAGVGAVGHPIAYQT